MIQNYNGSSWTEVADLNTARRLCRMLELTQLHLLLEELYSQVTDTESWNGTHWTEVTDLNYC